jgi:hypothetical protein
MWSGFLCAVGMQEILGEIVFDSAPSQSSLGLRYCLIIRTNFAPKIASLDQYSP